MRSREDLTSLICCAFDVGQEIIGSNRSIRVDCLLETELASRSVMISLSVRYLRYFAIS